MAYLSVAYCGEGSTDGRFYASVLDKILNNVLFGANYNVEYNIYNLDSNVGVGSFVEKHMPVIEKAIELDINIVFIHTDADNGSEEEAIRYKIEPLKQQIQDRYNSIVPIIPVYMTESWMLSNKSLLIQVLGSRLRRSELGLTIHPERLKDPKRKLKTIVDLSNSRHQLNKFKTDIEDLYGLIGVRINLDDLQEFNSYRIMLRRIEEKLQLIGILR